MSDVIIDVGSNKTSRINLGIQGENIVEHVIFNIASWIEEYGEGVAYVYAKRSGDLEPYPVALDMDMDAKTATWDVNLVDTAVKGRGSAQLVYVVDEDNEPDFSEDEVKKTKVFATTVQASLVVSSEENPEGYSTWLEVLGGYTVRVESAKAAAQAAQTAAETAQGLAEDAQEDAELARDSASASATSASASATSASNSATAAAASEATAASAAASASSDASDAAASATAAAQSAGNANLYQGWAQNYATNAQGYANDANNSKLAASTSAVNSANSALESEGYAVGTQDGEDVPSTSSYYHNNAKYYAEYAEGCKDGAFNAVSQAASYASSASQSASGALASENAASAFASSASTGASTATTKASEASASATSAAESASDASDSADAAAASAEAAAQSAASLTVDTELDDTSTNPVQNKVITSELNNKAEIDGFYEEMTVGDAEQLVATQVVNDSEPYNFRTTGGSADVGNREYLDAIVGGTVTWNQLMPISTLTGSATINGVTITNNYDGTLTLNGTCTQNDSRQLCNSREFIVGHKYLVCGMVAGSRGASYLGFGFAGFSIDRGSGGIYSNTQFTSTYIRLNLREGDSFDNLVIVPQWFDLTAMFGSTIADYIYSLEQANAGTGVAWFKKLFPKSYYPYNAGELLSVEGLESHDMVGFNQWDEQWRIGAFNSNGEFVTGYNFVCSQNPIMVFPSTIYATTKNILIWEFDADMNIVRSAATVSAGSAIRMDSNVHYIHFRTNYEATTYNHDICINLSWSGYRNGEYEEYVKHSYPLDNSLTLRGIPKLDASNNLYFDGDQYAADGTVTRKYGIVDLGTLNWTAYENGIFYNNLTGRKTGGQNIICAKYATSATQSWSSIEDKAVAGNTANSYIYVHDSAYSDAADFKTAMSGVYLVYELATPTTETAEPYNEVQICDDFGTEEFVTDSIVPVGHETRYPANLRDKLQHLPDLADADGYYIIGQSNKQMHLEPFRIPTAPSTDGTYTLTLTVSGGVPTYSWE